MCMCLAQVLLWLKQWDSSVFGSHIRATGDDVLSALRRHSSTIQKNASNRNFFSKSKGGPVASQDDTPLNAQSSNPEGLGRSFNKKSSVDNTPEQKVGQHCCVVCSSLWPKAVYKYLLVCHAGSLLQLQLNTLWCCRCCYYVVHLGLERPHLLMLQPDIVATMLWRSVLWSYNASSALVFNMMIDDAWLLMIYVLYD